MIPRVMVVDDSVVVRRTLAAILEADPDLELAGTVATGMRALEEMARIAPDFLVLDLEMPGCDGLEVLQRLRQQGQDLPVIMFSSPTERSARATLEALAAGAQDFVLKPGNMDNPGAARKAVEAELIGKLKEICGCAARPLPEFDSPTKPTTPAMAGSRQAGLLAIGCSTGGPNALSRVLAGLPASLPVPVVVVQHMPAVFIRSLAQRLDELSPMPVRVAGHGESLHAGRVYLAPGDRHMHVLAGRCGPRLELHEGEPENSCRPAVDVTFRTAARAIPEGVLGLVLTGMGQDGLRGCRDIVAAGGELILQDRQSSVVWGMPGAVAEAGLPADILPLDSLAAALAQRLKRP